jgi:hypothetical protein
LALDNIGRTYQRKSVFYQVIWLIVAILLAYSLYAFGYPYYKAFMFRRQVNKIANSDRLGSYFSDSALVSEILDAAYDCRVFCNDSDIDIIEQGRRRQVDVRFNVTVEYFSYHFPWFFTLRCVGWEDVGRPVYK